VRLAVEALEDRIVPHTVAYLVNGFTGGCIPPAVESYLRNLGVETHISNWNSIDRSGPSGGSLGEWADVIFGGGTTFLADMQDALDRLAPNDTVILIGHSLGAEQLLRVANYTSHD